MRFAQPGLRFGKPETLARRSCHRCGHRWKIDPARNFSTGDTLVAGHDGQAGPLDFADSVGSLRASVAAGLACDKYHRSIDAPDNTKSKCRNVCCIACRILSVGCKKTSAASAFNNAVELPMPSMAVFYISFFWWSGIGCQNKPRLLLTAGVFTLGSAYPT
jgi:hypothetical protein